MEKFDNQISAKECGLLVKYIFMGFTNAQIAKKLNYSKSSVTNRICRLFEKYGAKSRVDFVITVFKEIVEKYQSIADITAKKVNSLEAENIELKNYIKKIIDAKDNPKILKKTLDDIRNILNL